MAATGIPEDNRLVPVPGEWYFGVRCWRCGEMMLLLLDHSRGEGPISFRGSRWRWLRRRAREDICYGFRLRALRRFEWQGGEASVMTVYRLDPIPTSLTDPRWEASSVRECVWVRASTPDEARKKVARATLSVTPVRPGKPLLLSPWYDDTLAIYVMDTRSGVPEDTVITADGRPIR
jgi:hypothetical protein